MTADELTEALADLLRAITEDEEGDETELRGARLGSLRAGASTSDAGFVITLTDGAEFEVMVTQSRSAHDEDDDTEDENAP